MKIPFLSSLIRYFKIFYADVGSRLFILCAIIFVAGLSEGIGISLLLPLLNLENANAANNSYVSMIYQFFKKTSFGLSIQSILALMLFAFSIKGLLIFIQGAYTAGITTGLVQEKRLEFCRKYSGMKYSFYLDSTIGNLNNLVTTEIDRAVAGFSKYSDVLIMLFNILVYSTAAFLMNWKLTLLVVLVCSVLFYFLRALSQWIKNFSLNVSGLNAQIQSLLIQMIYNFKYLKATAGFPPLLKMLQDKIKLHRWYDYKTTTFSYISVALAEPLAVIFMSSLVIYHVIYLGRPMSEIFVLLIFFYKAFSKIFGLQIAWQKFSSTLGGVETVNTMAQQIQQEQEQYGKMRPERFKDAIKLQNVDARLGNKTVLKGVSIEILKNKMVGIVGHSGAGKTTIFDLLVGLIRPSSGRILFDDISYEDLDLAELRKFVGYVTQESTIFNDTIANNISFWQEMNEDGDEVNNRLVVAARQAHCLNFIEKTENGFETMIGDRGIKLSVGERQRLAIARELFKNPQIMIFDEATSALDSDSENLIQESIVEIKGSLTVVIIAHRLSTVKNCDMIYVISQGTVIEEGRFEELYNKPTSEFRKMCQLQHL